jgi:hypothetical protein
MKGITLFSLSLLLVLVASSCKKQAPVEEPQDAPTPQAQTVEEQAPAEEATVVVEEEPAPAEAEQPREAAGEELAPLPLELPNPMFVGTPENLSGIDKLEPDTKQPRPPFLAPKGVKNLALNKPVTSSEMEPFTGTLDMIVDGDKEATEGSVVELGPFEQWVQIDLEEQYELYAILFWHYHKTARVYFDVVVQVSNDPEFITEVTTLFNNDLDNSLKLGVGKDAHFIDKAEGKLVDAKGTKARYVRLYSQGNNLNDYSHYIEIEVYGK